jgi:hypothetical protein
MDITDGESGPSIIQEATHVRENNMNAEKVVGKGKIMQEFALITTREWAIMQRSFL